MAKKETAKKKKRTRRFLLPSHTKGYYRFSKDFPSVTDSEGYRDNDIIVNSPAKKASVRRGLIVLFVCIFAASFFVTTVGFSVSKLPAQINESDIPASAEKTVFSGYNAAYLTGDVLSFSSAESVISKMRVLGVDTVVIDFKDAAGNFYYNPTVNVSAEALSKASENPKKIIDEFKEADIAVIARFACFADDIYARTNQKEAAFVSVTTEEGTQESIWYSNGNDSHAWLNPYSSEVQYYLRVAVEDINNMNVDGIIFDYIEFPADADANDVRFRDAGEKSPSSAMSSFIELLNSVYVDCKTAAVVPFDIMLDAMKSGNTPEAFLSGCDYVIPDARLSLMPENTAIGTRQYAKPHLSPTEFITDYMNGVLKFASGEDYSVKIIPLLEATDTSGKQLSALAGVKGDSYIMYNAEMNYTDDNFIAN